MNFWVTLKQTLASSVGTVNIPSTKIPNKTILCNLTSNITGIPHEIRKGSHGSYTEIKIFDCESQWLDANKTC